VTEALTEKLGINDVAERPWMRSFGGLRTLHKESARIDELVKEEFDGIEPQDRR
jgi:hypothetical protein